MSTKGYIFEQLGIRSRPWKCTVYTAWKVSEKLWIFPALQKKRAEKWSFSTQELRSLTNEHAQTPVYRPHILV